VPLNEGAGRTPHVPPAPSGAYYSAGALWKTGGGAGTTS
jgi:hypothetical protein